MYKAYREAKRALKGAIAKGKAKAHELLLASLDRDPWGRPYRSVRGKLRAWAPPLTQSLRSELLREVVSALFHVGEEHTPPSMVPLQSALMSDAVYKDDNVPGSDPGGNGVVVICCHYAHDMLLLRERYRDAAILATAGVAQVVERIRRLSLEVALDKSEALCFHGPRRGPPAGSHIEVGGVRIAVGTMMRALSSTAGGTSSHTSGNWPSN